ARGRAPGRELRRRRGVVRRRAAARGAHHLTVRPIVALLLVLLTAGCAGIGGPVAGAPAHHRENGFANVSPSYEPASGWTRFTFFISRMWSATFSPRSATFKSIPRDLPAIRDNRGAATVTWVGHATLLIQLDGVNILTDPTGPSARARCRSPVPSVWRRPGSSSRICRR